MKLEFESQIDFRFHWLYNLCMYTSCTA